MTGRQRAKHALIYERVFFDGVTSVEKVFEGILNMLEEK